MFPNRRQRVNCRVHMLVVREALSETTTTLEEMFTDQKTSRTTLH
jgi:hypothetical protein